MINLKKLSKALGTKPDALIWWKTQEDDRKYDFISNGRFIIKVESNKVDTNVVSKLVKFTGRVPEIDGAVLKYRDGGTTEDGDDFKKNWEDMVNDYDGRVSSEVSDTGLMRKSSYGNGVIFRRNLGDYLVYDERYTDLIDPKSKGSEYIVTGKSNASPLRVSDGVEILYVLPIKNALCGIEDIVGNSKEVE